MKLELRAITNRPEKRDSAVMISSTIPSAKYSCSGSPLRFWKDRTAMEGAHATPANGRSRGSIAGWPHLDVPPAARTEIPRRRAGPCERHSGEHQPVGRARPNGADDQGHRERTGHDRRPHVPVDLE